MHEVEEVGGGLYGLADLISNRRLRAPFLYIASTAAARHRH